MCNRDRGRPHVLLAVRNCAMKLWPAVLSCAFAAGLLGPIGCAQAGEAIKEGFEGEDVDKDIASRFKVCHRPENEFRFSTAEPRSEKQSLELSIIPPVFVALSKKKFELNPKNCLVGEDKYKYKKYIKDNYERAEIWEDRSQNPSFGERKAMFYGFSMRISAAGVPPGDLNRLVLGQWKAGCNGWCDASPF